MSSNLPTPDFVPKFGKINSLVIDLHSSYFWNFRRKSLKIVHSTLLILYGFGDSYPFSFSAVSLFVILIFCCEIGVLKFALPAGERKRWGFEEFFEDGCNRDLLILPATLRKRAKIGVKVEENIVCDKEIAWKKCEEILRKFLKILRKFLKILQKFRRKFWQNFRRLWWKWKSWSLN